MLKMGRNKKYSGYKSFQYLEAGLDYRAFKMPKEIDRVEPYILPLSKSEEERTEEIIEKNIFISLHEHPFLWPPEDPTESLEYRRQARMITAYEGLSVSGLDVVFDHMLDGALATSKSGWKWDDVIHDLGMRLSDLAHQDFITHCKRVEDIFEAYEKGKIAFIFSVEGAAPIENEVDRIDILHGLGVRCLGLTYSESNMLGTGCHDNDLIGGLTDFGYDCVKRMNKIGMLIEISHAADQTCLDAIDASDKPVVASHNGPAAIARGHVNPDEVLVALAQNEGVIGINGCGGGRGMSTKKHPAGNLESCMECIEYCIELMGVDHVGFGIDAMYGDHRQAIGGSRLPRGRHRRPSKSKDAPWKSPLSQTRFEGWNDPANDPGYVRGLENPTDNHNQIRWLVKHGYSDEDIIKVMGGNALRMLKAVWY